MPYRGVHERFAFLCLVMWVGLAQTVNTSTQEMSVRLIDVRNGHAYANETVQVQFHIPQTPELQTLEGKTGADGAAIFHLSDPVPANIAVSVRSAQLYPCYRSYPIDTQKVFHEGLVSRCSRPKEGCYCKFGKLIDDIQNKPRELVLPTRPFTKWEKFMSHIWE